MSFSCISLFRVLSLNIKFWFKGFQFIVILLDLKYDVILKGWLNHFLYRLSIIIENGSMVSWNVKNGSDLHLSCLSASVIIIFRKLCCGFYKTLLHEQKKKRTKSWYWPEWVTLVWLFDLIISSGYMITHSVLQMHVHVHNHKMRDLNWGPPTSWLPLILNSCNWWWIQLE